MPLTRAEIESRLRPVWRRWHGVIPVWAAAQAGVPADRLRRWAYRNPDVDHPERGVYLWYPDCTGDDANIGADWRLIKFASALAWAGPEARLWGPSVVELAHLGTFGGGDVCLEIPKPRHPHDGISWITNGTDASDSTVMVLGLPCQPIPDALESAATCIDQDKFGEAVDAASRRGLINEPTADMLRQRYLTPL